MNEEEKKAFADMKALLDEQKTKLDTYDEAKKVADQAKVDAEVAEVAAKQKIVDDESARVLAEANSKKTAEQIKIEVDKTELYKKAARDAAAEQLTRSQILTEISSNDYLTKVLLASEGTDYVSLPNADLIKAVKIAKESAKTFKPVISGNPSTMTMDEAMEAWDKKEQARIDGGR